MRIDGEGCITILWLLAHEKLQSSRHYHDGYRDAEINILWISDPQRQLIVPWMAESEAVKLGYTLIKVSPFIC